MGVVCNGKIVNLKKDFSNYIEYFKKITYSNDVQMIVLPDLSQFVKPIKYTINPNGLKKIG